MVMYFGLTLGRLGGRLPAAFAPLLALFVVWGFFVRSQPASAADLPAQAAELRQQAESLWKQNQFDQALKKGAAYTAAVRRARGAHDPQYADALQWLAELYNTHGDFPRAEPLYREALRVRKVAFGEKSPAYAIALNNLAFVYGGRRDFNQAQNLYSEALRALKLAHLDHGLEYTTVAHNFGFLYRDHKDYAAAEAQLGAVVSIERELDPKGLGDLPDALFQLATVHQSRGDFEGARPLIDEATEITKHRAQKKPDHIFTLIAWARQCRDCGDSAAADHLLSEALRAWGELKGEHSPEYAGTLAELAKYRQSRGDYAAAEPMLTRVMQIWWELQHRNIGYAASLTDLALLREARGNLAGAEPLLVEALGIRHDIHGERSAEYAAALSDLANLRRLRGDYANAAPLFTRALEIRRDLYGDHSPQYAEALDQLAGFRAAMGDVAAAEPLYRQALQIWKRSDGVSSASYAHGLNSLALFYAGTKRFEAAEPLFRELIALENRVSDRSMHHVIVLHNCALMYVEHGDLAKGERLLREAMALHRGIRGDRDPGYADDSDLLAGCLLHGGQFEDAIVAYRESWDVLRRHRDTDLIFESAAEQMQFTTQVVERTWVYLSVACTAPQSKNAALLAGDIVVGLKGAVMETLAERRRQAALQGDPRLTELFNQWRDAGQALAKLAMATPPPGQLESYQHRMEELQRQKEEAEKQLAAESGSFAAAHAEARIGISEVAAVLGPDTALVEYVRYRARHIQGLEHSRTSNDPWAYAAVVVRGGAPGRAVDLSLVPLGDARTIDALIETWRRAVRQPGNSSDLEAAGRHLAAAVWAPVASQLGGRKRVYLSPDGQLAFVSFAALPGSRAGSYLIEDLDLTYLATGRDLLRKGGSAQGPSLVVGDPDYGTARPVATAGVGGVPFWYADWNQRFAGVRRWVAVDSTHWEERHPDGHTDRFEVLGPAEQGLGTGTIARAMDGSGRQVLIPPPKNGALLKTRGQSDAPWAVLGAIRVGTGPDDASALPAFGPQPFWYGYWFEPQPGVRRWSPVDDKHWEERLPDGRAEAFEVIASLTHGPDTGTLVRSLNTVGKEVLIPAQTNGSILKYRGSANSKWVRLGSIQLGIYRDSAEKQGTPPAQPVALATAQANGTRRQSYSDLRRACGPGLSRLPATAIEAERVAALLARRDSGFVQRITGAAATEAAVKAVKHPRVLHLATHGFFLDDVGSSDSQAKTAVRGVGGAHTLAPSDANAGGSAAALQQLLRDGEPMRRSGLLLAGANRTLAGQHEPGGDDGILTAEEVASMDLWGTDLVVLSACETGLGVSSGGEGVYGLRRAFVLAGAQSVVMSLWSVQDDATCQLMEGLYKHIAAGELPPRALLDAQRQFIAAQRQAKTGREHPFYWAAFVASGFGTGLDKPNQ